MPTNNVNANPKTIGIIGYGIAGLSVTENLVKHAPPGTNIVIFQPDKSTGPWEDNRSFSTLTNTYANHSPLPGGESLAEVARDILHKSPYTDHVRVDPIKPFEGSTCLPRAIVGSLKPLLSEKIKTLADEKNVNIENKSELFLGAAPKNGSTKLTITSKDAEDKENQLDVDEIFLCMGAGEKIFSYTLEGGHLSENLAELSRILNESANSSNDPTNHVTAVAGLGLEFVDFVRECFLKKYPGKIYAFSRSGELPSIRPEESEHEPKHFTKENLAQIFHEKGFIECRDIFSLMEKDFSERAMQEEYTTWSESEAFLSPLQKVIDQSFHINSKDKIGKFLSFLKKLVDQDEALEYAFRHIQDTPENIYEFQNFHNRYRNPMPESAKNLIMDLHDQNRLFIGSLHENNISKGTDRYHISGCLGHASHRTLFPTPSSNASDSPYQTFVANQFVDATGKKDSIPPEPIQRMHDNGLLQWKDSHIAVNEDFTSICDQRVHVVGGLTRGRGEDAMFYGGGSFDKIALDALTSVNSVYPVKSIHLHRTKSLPVLTTRKRTMSITR